MADQFETKWQASWDAAGTYAAPNPGEPGFDPNKPKKFILDMFPYPSGVGLHVGHPLGYIATDIYARYFRMTGHNVLHSMGFDAFGLPAEQFAVQTGTHPRITTERNIATMRVQLKRLGLGHESRRSVSTTDPAYYKWTQWIFLQIFNSWYDQASDRARPIKELETALAAGTIATSIGKSWSSLTADERRAEIDARRLAFCAEIPVNWCPMLGTVLANEEVTADGRSERGNYPVYKRPLKQWMLRITAYAERLINDLDAIDWPEPIKMLQRNWIGRSEGAHVDFVLGTPSFGTKGTQDDRITVFTTRPDTLFGATYMVLSPEHPLVDSLAPAAWPESNIRAPWKGTFPGASPANTASPKDAIAAYRKYVASRSDMQRTDGKEKTGVFTGAYAINPVTKAPVPIFIADYVLMGYGTGAIMAVPAHDERDFEFAQTLQLPIKDVVYPRHVLAMKHFAEHAYPNIEPPTHWRAELADFLGWVTSNADKPTSLDSLLTMIRGRRRTSPVPETLPAPIDPNKPGSIGERRGSTQTVWLETIESLGFRNIHDLERRFRDGYQSAAGEAYSGPGTAVNSANSTGLSIDGLHTAQAKAAVIAWLEKHGLGKGTTTYKLRDWLFSRQRYWGEPFPIVFDDQGRPHALPESALPVLLPELENFQPESSEDPNAPVRTPLARAADWTKVTLDLGEGVKTYTRETNTMPNWAGSCWYYLRYLDPENNAALVDKDTERYWMSGLATGRGGGAAAKSDGSGGVDLYVGGVEHAVLHLLYARFWHKVLFDLGHVSSIEPFHKLFNQGYIQAYAFTDERGVYVDAFKVTLADGSFAMENQDKPGPFFYNGQPVKREYGKMGKSLKNAISPDEICTQYGCDTMRLYEMSMGPLEASKPWNPRDIAGSYRFLQRVWRNLIDENTGMSRVSTDSADRDTLRILHKTIQGVRTDMEGLRFHTVVSKLIELNNHIANLKSVPFEAAKALVLMLSPLAPHIAEELWHRIAPELAAKSSVVHATYPTFDTELSKDDSIEVPISVNGKVRMRITVIPGLDAKALESAALADPKVQELFAGKQVKKVIAVPGKMVNLVIA
jgi:leucyl-tRNA synthetase